MKKLFLLFSLAILSIGTYAASFYVSTLGNNDDNDGTSWLSAKRTLSGAYNIASSGDTIHVAAGTFNFATPLGIGSKSNVVFLGGYNVNYDTGTATRNKVAGGKPWEFEYETILNALAYTGTAANTDNKNSRIVHIFTTASNIEINGFTFQNGGGKHSTNNELGGALNVSGTGTSKIRFCIFRNNSVTKNDFSSGGMGGAIHLNNVSAIVEGCYIYNNSSTIGSSGGGGMFAQATADGIEIKDCTFDSNFSNVSGGGLRTNRAFKTSIKNCTFVNNLSKDGSSYKNGAALYSAGVASGTIEPSTDEIENCLFYNNEGGTSIILNGATMKNCTYVNNIGGFRTGYEGAGKIYNTVLWGNKTTAGVATGFEFNKNPELVQFCTSDVAHSGDYVSDFLLINADNSAIDGPHFKTPTTFAGSGNLSGETPDWSITQASALKTAGSLANAAGTTDIAGNSRPTSGTTCSIGAYEFVPDISTVLKIESLNIAVKVIGNNLDIKHEDAVSVKIFNTSGQLIASSAVAVQHNIELQRGLYIALVNLAGQNASMKIAIR